MRRGDKPAGPEQIKYRRADRRADRKNGKRDGRKQIPAYTGLIDLLENAERITTPYQEQLSSLGLYQINDEYRSFLERTSLLQRNLVRLRSLLVTDGEARARAEAGLVSASAELTAEELLPRNPQEIALAGSVALRARRMTMRERRIEAANGVLQQCIEAVQTRRQEIDEVAGRIDHEFALAQALSRRLGDYFVLRIATYWDWLAQAHPEGRHLASLVPIITPAMPAWVDGTCQGGVVTLPQTAQEVRAA